MTDSRVSYRERIYAVYASGVQGTGIVFDSVTAKAWGNAYGTYLERWLPRDPRAAILDAACGGGRLLDFLKTRGYLQLTGVDLSEEQVALARQVIDDVAQTDVLGFLSRNASRFDVIIGLDIIEHLKKDEVLAFLDGCLGALKPGGRLVLQTPNGESPSSGAVRYGDFTHEVCFTPNSLRALLELCGFRGIEVRECRPIAHGPLSALRAILWRLLRVGRLAASLIETGSAGSGVCTRVFLASGLRNLGPALGGGRDLACGPLRPAERPQGGGPDAGDGGPDPRKGPQGSSGWVDTLPHMTSRECPRHEPPDRCPCLEPTRKQALLDGPIDGFRQRRLWFSPISCQ